MQEYSASLKDLGRYLPVATPHVVDYVCWNWVKESLNLKFIKHNETKKKKQFFFQISK